ncbi:RNA polymerase sigma factor [Shewanella sp. GXUN23E]|uniref:RNA polymerase sigma factor n=1 Tax=Shewanella sp. GXUN23E TaxID=3422498 RepID=UPI003D7EB3A8
MDDQDLLKHAQSGDEQAFQQLYLRHKNRVYAIALRLTTDIRTAEELTQDCFVHLWHKLALFDGRSAFTTWLHRLCINHCLGALRRQRHFWQRFQSAETDIATQHAGYQGLDRLVVRLPRQARLVFVLHALEGYQHDEIAVLLNIATGTSKAQYHRARNLLKEMLND